MHLKRYCVTVLDHWTPTREFWTLEGARRFYGKHRAADNVFKWEDGKWAWMFGANEHQRF